MEKYSLITEIMRVMDDNERLRRDNADLLRVLNGQLETTGIDEAKEIADARKNGGDHAAFDYFALKEGRKAIFEDCVYSWRGEVEGTKNDDGTITVTPYDDDYKRNLINHVPDYMSRRDFMEYFEIEFRKKYEEEKAEVIASFNDDEESGE